MFKVKSKGTGTFSPNSPMYKKSLISLKMHFGFKKSISLKGDVYKTFKKYD